MRRKSAGEGNYLWKGKKNGLVRLYEVDGIGVREDPGTETGAIWIQDGG